QKRLDQSQFLGIFFSDLRITRDFLGFFQQLLKRQVAPVNCVIILAGVYSTYSSWIKKEIEIAKGYRKPIIAVEPWGSERTSQIVKRNANAIVKWQSSSIVSAIRQYSI
ncbi:molecular chaperone Tir, partial [Acidithiobacillus ferriphilus]|uniref:TIR domain-containing protein n=1 Tax=Acidithiobacillus ferriphilus TaxID=1689834 RepID=UPI001C069124